MTDFDFCCLCASDEGVFLDIFTATGHQLGNRSFLKEFETCLSFKVRKNETLSSKICHKCAIELGECNRFVQKYRQAAFNPKAKTSKSAARRSCCLCFTTANSKYFFTLAKDFRSTVTCLQKVYECLKLQITPEEAEGKVICLFCRYNLDVLYDLKKLANEVPPKLQIIAETKAIVANLPKTETFVVSRKTTVVRQPKIELQTLLRSETEYDAMARRQLRSKKLASPAPATESKPRVCGQCKTSIEGGVDMYRLHKVGVTVCKMCWITMDPLKTTRGDKRKRNNRPESKSTKLCTVFLRDVLSPASSKEETLQKVSKVGKETEEEIIYILSDDSSAEEERPNNRERKNLRQRWDGKATKSDQEFDRKLRPGMKRPLKGEDAGNNDKSSKKLKSVKKPAVNISPELRRSTRSHNSDSEIVIAKMNLRSDSIADKPRSLRSSNNIRSEDKLDNKKKTIRKTSRAKDEAKSKSEDLSTTEEDEVGKKLRKVRTQVPLDSKSKLSESLRVEKKEEDVKPRKVSVRSKPVSKSPVQKKSRVRSVDDHNRSTRLRTPAKRSKALMMVSFPFKLKDPYECKVCGTICRNKVVGMKHELTHFKQVEVKIEKLNVAHHFQTVNDNSPTREISQERSNDGCPSDSSQTNRNLSEPEVPARADTEDEDNRSEDRTPAEQSVPTASGLKLSQGNARSTDLEDAEESDAVAPTEQPPVADASTLAGNDSKDDETTERVVPDLALGNEESPEEIDTPNNDEMEKRPEADSSREPNADNVDNSANKNASEIVEEDTAEESVEKSEETVDDIEDETCVEEKNKEEIVPSVVPADAKRKGETENIDLGEDIESDIDIRIVDTGSSADDSSEQAEKKESNAKDATDSSRSKDATDEKSADIEPTAAKEESKVENATDRKDAEIESTEAEKSKDGSDEKILSKDESQTIAASTIEPEKKPENERQVAEDHHPAETTSTKSEEETSEEVKKSPFNDGISESSIKTTEVNGRIKEVSTTSTVTEILQEVIDLASAEVQKRAEREDTAAETLEDISNEIKKTALESSRRIEATKTSEKTGNDKIGTDTTLNDLN